MTEFLTDDEKLKLTSDNLELYEKAVRYCGNEHAGGYDGWSEGHKILKELGWVEHRREEGHRVFVSLVKPTQQPENEG